MARKYYEPAKTPLETYKKNKLKILKRDFRITLTDEELERIKSLKTEVQIDQFCLGILNKYWG